jgi:hypothetical protein
MSRQPYGAYVSLHPSKWSLRAHRFCVDCSMSQPLQFGLEGTGEDASDAPAEFRDLPDDGSSHDSLEAHTDSEGEEDEPADVRSFSHSYVLQTALQKNQSDPHFNPAHSKIKQPANILQDPPVSSLGGTTAAGAAADDNTPSLSDHGSVAATLRSEQLMYVEACNMPSLSDENITAGRWIGCCPCLPSVVSAREAHSL